MAFGDWAVVAFLLFMGLTGVAWWRWAKLGHLPRNDDEDTPEFMRTAAPIEWMYVRQASAPTALAAGVVCFALAIGWAIAAGTGHPGWIETMVPVAGGILVVIGILNYIGYRKAKSDVEQARAAAAHRIRRARRKARGADGEGGANGAER